MTKREFYNAVIEANVSEDTVAFAKAEIDKLDVTNEKRKNTPTKTQKLNAPLYDKIVNEILTHEAQTTSDIAGILEVSPQKASGLLRQLVKEGRAVASDVKVPKKGTQKGYTLPED